MKLSRRIALDLTVAQERHMRRAAGTARFAWNSALADHRAMSVEARAEPDEARRKALCPTTAKLRVSSGGAAQGGAAMEGEAARRRKDARAAFRSRMPIEMDPVPDGIEAWPQPDGRRAQHIRGAQSGCGLACQHRARIRDRRQREGVA